MVLSQKFVTYASVPDGSTVTEKGCRPAGTGEPRLVSAPVVALMA